MEGPVMSRRRFLITIGTGLALAGPARAIARGGRTKPGHGDQLIVADMQNRVVPRGPLPVAGGEQSVQLVNRLARAFENVVLTMHWHTPGHVSFASSHAGKKPFESVSLVYGTQ